MPIQFDPFVASQGFAAGLAGKLPEFQQSQNQKRQLDIEQQKQDAEMQTQVQNSQYKDAYVAQQLLANEDYDGIVKLGITRLTMLQGLNANPAETQRVLQIAIAARNGDPDARRLLKGELDSGVKVGIATGVLKAPEPTSYKSEVDALGVRRYTEGPDIGKPVPGFETSKPEGGGDTPASILEMEAFKKMNKEDQDTFLKLNKIIEPITLPPEAYSVEGEDFLSFVPINEREAVRALAEGRSTPTQLGRSGDRARLMEYVYQYDPTYDLATVTARARSINDFNAGKSGTIVRSIGVSIDHLSTLQSAADALKNGDLRVFNSLGNRIATETGQDAPTDFDATKQIVADEVTKAILGGPGALADRAAIKATFNAANSPEQLLGVINRYKELLAGQLNGLKRQYEVNTGKTDFNKWLSPAVIELQNPNASGLATNPESAATTSTTALRPDPSQFDSGAR